MPSLFVPGNILEFLRANKQFLDILNLGIRNFKTFVSQKSAHWNLQKNVCENCLHWLLIYLQYFISMHYHLFVLQEWISQSNLTSSQP